MSQTAKHTPEAEALADAILKAAGSGLRHYSMARTREEIFAAAQQGIDAARTGLLASLESIAKTPLWGEKIEDEGTRKEYAESREYDVEADEFNPSCDTESTMLRDAVEAARAAIAKPTGRAA